MSAGEQESMERTWRFKATIDVLQKGIGPGDRVLEVGATDASFRRYVKCAEWLTADRYGNPDLKADLNGPDASIPLADRSVDAVVCTEVLEHLGCGTPLLREISRILRPTGRAYISVPNMSSLGSRLRWAIGRIPDMAASGDCGRPLSGTGILVDGNWVAGHVVDFNERRLEQYLLRAGLRVTHKHSTGATVSGVLRIPPMVTPTSLADFVFVTAVLA